MIFLLKLFCCISATILLGSSLNMFMHYCEKRPIVEVREQPFYITRTYKEIKNGYQD